MEGRCAQTVRPDELLLEHAYLALIRLQRGITILREPYNSLHQCTEIYSELLHTQRDQERDRLDAEYARSIS